MYFFGQTEEIKYLLSEELITLENTRNNISPVDLVRRAKDLLARLRATPRWDDSRSGITASVLTLFSDEKTRPFLKYTDISSRTTALIVWAATKLTPQQAQQEGVSAYQRMSTADLEKHLLETQRLSAPGGQAWEVARETPAPFVDEAVRRGGQVKDVGAEIAEKTAPIGQAVVDRLDEHQVTNPLLGIVSLSLIVFMKRKLLAILIIIVLIYLTKQRQIAEIKQKVTSVQEKITGAAETVQETVDKLN